MNFENEHAIEETIRDAVSDSPGITIHDQTTDVGWSGWSELSTTVKRIGTPIAQHDRVAFVTYDGDAGDYLVESGPCEDDGERCWPDTTHGTCDDAYDAFVEASAALTHDQFTDRNR